MRKIGDSVGQFFNVEDTFKFGKYVGYTVEEVAMEDPSYIRWMEEETSHDFSQEVLDLIE